MEWSRLTRRYALLESLQNRRQIVRVNVAETFHEVRRRGFARKAEYAVALEGARGTAADGIDDPAARFGKALRVGKHLPGLRELIS